MVELRLHKSGKSHGRDEVRGEGGRVMQKPLRTGARSRERGMGTGVYGYAMGQVACQVKQAGDRSKRHGNALVCQRKKSSGWHSKWWEARVGWEHGQTGVSERMPTLSVIGLAGIHRNEGGVVGANHGPGGGNDVVAEDHEK